jgi:hypothetical protein
MSFEITTAFVKQYHSNVDFLSQQKGSRLRDCVRTETQEGKEAYYDQIGPTAARKRTSRHSDTPLISTPHARRRTTLVDYDWADLIDDMDKVRTLINPQSLYAQNAAFAMGRSMDDELITAFYGSAAAGEEGGTATTFDTSNNQIAVNLGGSNIGLTIAKLVRAKRIMDGWDIDPDIPRYIACHAKQIEDLLGTTQITSSDYNTVKALAAGQLDSFLGFKFIQIERLPVDANSYRRVMAWAKDGMLMAIGQESKAQISQRADKNYSTQVFYSMSIGAVRMEEKKCVEILCLET